MTFYSRATTCQPNVGNNCCIPSGNDVVPTENSLVIKHFHNLPDTDRKYCNQYSNANRKRHPSRFDQLQLWLDVVFEKSVSIGKLYHESANPPMRNVRGSPEGSGAIEVRAPLDYGLSPCGERVPCQTIGEEP
jgi:hypothetical protein